MKQEFKLSQVWGHIALLMLYSLYRENWQNSERAEQVMGREDKAILDGSEGGGNFSYN